jgi:hypothetical protein
MRTLLVLAVAPLASLAVGCDSTPPLPISTGGAGTTGAAGATNTFSPTGAGGGSVSPGTGASMCGPTGDRLRTSSIAETQNIIRGTWMLCSSLGLFDKPQAGMSIGDDDRYVFLDLVGGRLVPKTGLENKGHLEYLDTSAFNGPGSVQVNFVSDSGYTIIAGPPIFSNDPRQLLINNEGVEMYTYAAVSTTQVSGAAGAGVTAAPPVVAQPSGLSACERPTGDRLSPATLPDLQQTIRGTWQLCSMVGLFDRPQAGIFIGDDDRYVFLDLVGGKLVPQSGLENKGQLTYLGTSQVNFTSDMGGTIIAAPPIFSDDPRQLLINNEGVEMYTYGRVP